MTNRRSEGVAIIGREAAAARGGIGFVDGSLCAAHLALWHGAVATDLMLPSLDLLDAAGLRAVDVLDPEMSALFARRGENPLRLARIAARRLTKTPANVWVNARCLLGGMPLDASLIELGIAQLADCGIHRLTIFDALNDVGAMAVVTRESRKLGLGVSAALVYQASPYHDDRYFTEQAHLLAGSQVDSVVVVDLAGSLTPEATGKLVAAVKQGAAETPIEFRTFCRSGVAEMSCFEALTGGASVLHTASDALSGGRSLPSTIYFVEHLSRRQVSLQINQCGILLLDEYFAALAAHEGLPCGAHELPDSQAERYQIPVALLRKCEEAAAAAGVAVDALWQACVKVQKEMGTPTLAHPVGAMVLDQALHAGGGNASTKVTREVAAFANGAFGTPPGPLSANLRQRAGKSSTMPIAEGCSFVSREQAILAAWFPGVELAPSLAFAPEPPRAGTPEQYLKEQLERLPALRSIRVQKGALFFELNRDRSGGATT